MVYMGNHPERADGAEQCNKIFGKKLRCKNRRAGAEAEQQIGTDGAKAFQQLLYLPETAAHRVSARNENLLYFGMRNKIGHHRSDLLIGNKIA